MQKSCLVHTGPYTALNMTYGAISKYEDNGYEVIAPPRELYLKGGWITDDPNEYVTELQFSVSKKNS